MLAHYIKTHHILLQDVHFAELSIFDFYDFITWTWLLRTYSESSLCENVLLQRSVCARARASEPSRWIHLKKSIRLSSRQAKQFTHQPIFYWLQQIDWTIGLVLFCFVYSPTDVQRAAARVYIFYRLLWFYIYIISDSLFAHLKHF